MKEKLLFWLSVIWYVILIVAELVALFLIIKKIFY